MSKETTQWQRPGLDHRPSNRKSNALTTGSLPIHLVSIGDMHSAYSSARISYVERVMFADREYEENPPVAEELLEALHAILPPLEVLCEKTQSCHQSVP